MTTPDIHRCVLDKLLDGVLVVGHGGRIETLNPAAESTLGVEPGEVARNTFAEMFITCEGLNEFTELNLGAAAQGADPERRVVEVEGAAGTYSLYVAPFYMRPAGERHRRSQLVDVNTAKEEFEATRQKAHEKALATAELAMENVQAVMRAAEEELEQNVVRAPLASTALLSVRAAREPMKRVKFRKGNLLLRTRIGSGMSAKLRIVTYDDSEAMLVPLAAVRQRGGKHWLRVLDEGGEVREREVAVGPTTQRRLELASELEPGESVVVPDD